ncbi:uncharacterized protein [Drosophila kikkawai]|uniref:Uncharacterized protein n=1 Tax=Drosophila kikkawai TaxID=30033 RepID=A0A6P4JEM6_DROKI|nr:uncharacterized protein LOC108082220 [Drosophila kikkawai]
MISLLIHQAVDSLIQNIYPKLRSPCLRMANNFIQELQQQQDSLDPPAEASTFDSDHKSNFSTKSLVNDIIGRSLDHPKEDPKKPSSRISFRALARVVVVLNRAFKETVPENADLDYWRNLAQSRGDMNSRYCQVIEMQSKRIQTLENDLRTLIGLARETREMLAEIAEEKQDKQDRGDGGITY